MTRSESCSRPLFLMILLEELRVFGRFEQLSLRLQSWLLSADVEALFDRVLLRLERDYGENADVSKTIREE